ncbi:DoxX family protein [Streptomyces sp. NK08204]|uniref:DoxX family protein n=1 Tax=Streptomyces sp. NK08204 TaxID=2873260 RepID=UPI0027E2A975|nr:DoxX family protein [Streptomyces sp. NK08204]
MRRGGGPTPPSSDAGLPAPAFLKAVGAAGLPLGLLGPRPLGVAAGIGLVLFCTGALAARVRARMFHTIAFPGPLHARAPAAPTVTVTR